MRKKKYKDRKNNAPLQPYLKYHSILYIEGKAKNKDVTIGKIIDEMIEQQKDYADVVNEEIEGFKIK